MLDEAASSPMQGIIYIVKDFRQRTATMARFNWKSIIISILVPGVVLTTSSPLLAQWSTSISQGEITRPWEQHLAVLQSFSGLSATLADTQASAQVALEFAELESDINAFELEIEKFIYRLAGEPTFVYAAAETSQLLSTRLAKVYTKFGSLYLALGVQEREDAIAAQASLDSLRKIMAEKTKFENDVTNALGSGSRQQIMGVANRWWIGREKSVEVQKYAAILRQQLEGVSTSEESQ